jgi:hypothetical protein
LDLLIGKSARDLDLFLVGIDSDQAALERAKQLLLNFLQIEKENVKEKRQIEKTEKYRYIIGGRYLARELEGKLKEEIKVNN